MRSTALAELATLGSVTRAEYPENVPAIGVKGPALPLVETPIVTVELAEAFVHETMISEFALSTSSRPGDRSFNVLSVTLKLGLDPEPRAAPAESLQVTRIVCAPIDALTGMVTTAYPVLATFGEPRGVVPSSARSM